MNKKIVIINDLHFGLRGGNVFFENQLKHFIEEVLFPHLIKMKEDGEDFFLLINGDTFDNRRSILTKSMTQFKEILLDRLEEIDVETIISLGNHDIVNRNTLYPNSIEPLIGGYDNIRVIKAPTSVRTEGSDVNIVILPWICEENEIETMKLVESDSFKDSVVFTHLDVIGSSFSKNVKSKDGYETGLFSKAKIIFNGHIHIREDLSKNFKVTGSQYQQTWTDYFQIKGFHIYDLVENETEFIKNPRRVFIKLIYTDGEISIDLGERKKISDFNQSMFNKLNKKIVKVFIESVSDDYHLKEFLNKLGVHVEKLTIDNMKDDLEEMVYGDDSIDTPLSKLLSEYIETRDLPNDVSAERLSHIFDELHGRL